MTEYDARQLSLMDEKISQFRNGEIDFGVLVQDLEALLNALESADFGWKTAFHDEWFNLEQVYAVALDRGDNAVVLENEELISSTLLDPVTPTVYLLNLNC